MTDEYFIGESTGTRYQFVSQQGNGRITIQETVSMTKAQALDFMSRHPARQEYDITVPNWAVEYVNDELKWAPVPYESVGTLYYAHSLEDDLEFTRAALVYFK